MTAPPTPFTLLTGFLGAGKTTTLNRLLGAGHGVRVAVLVNELGRIAIDTGLIVGRGGDVLELAGGCVCCKVGDDLWDGVADVLRRSRPDHVVLETTGVAEPAAIVEAIGSREDVVLAGVVCVVDARAGVEQLGRYEEARAQVRAADRLLISKLDVADPSEVYRRLDELAPGVERAAFPGGEERALAAWMLAHGDAQAHEDAHAHEDEDGDGDGDEDGQGHGHRHDLQMVAASHVDDVPLLGERVLEVVKGMGDGLVRVKGWIRLVGGRTGWLELAGGELRLEDRAGGPGRTELVLIGEGLDEAALRRRLHACRGGQ